MRIVLICKISPNFVITFLFILITCMEPNGARIRVNDAKKKKENINGSLIPKFNAGIHDSHKNGS